MATFPSHPQADPFAFPDAEQAAALFGPSKAMSLLTLQVRRLAPYLRSVLLTGAGNCGQEAVARLVLMHSSRPGRPFLRLQASEADNLFNSALSSGKWPPDVFLFLPDADRLSLAAQEQTLLLFKRYQLRKITIVAAATENLRMLASIKNFLPELAGALGQVSLRVPSLAERNEDLPLMVTQIVRLRCLQKQQPEPLLSESFLRATTAHEWPGNIAELSRLVGYLLDRDLQKAVWDQADFAQATKALQFSEDDQAPADFVTLDTVVRQHVLSVLVACAGNRMRAAEVLGIARSTLYRLLADIHKSNSRQLLP